MSSRNRKKIPLLYCPTCSRLLVLTDGKMRCDKCGYVDVEGDDKPFQIRATNTQPRAIVTSSEEIDPWAQASFETAVDAEHDGNIPAAIAALRKVLDQEPNFADANLMMARLVDDPEQKREYLSVVLANEPNHLDATREIMVLNGTMTREEADRTYHHNEAEVRDGGTTTAQIENLICPTCGGRLTVEAGGRVICHFCGYTPTAAGGQMGGGSLTEALLKRKAQQVVWKIGGRVLHCNRCGAERTVPAGTLSTQCPFCDSNLVVVQDALGSFEQPHGVVPFVLSEEQARDRVMDQLGSLGERISGLFKNQKVKQISLQGVFLPFWVFDIVASVVVNQRDKGSHNRAPSNNRFETIGGLNDVGVCAVKNPPPAVTGPIRQYDFDRAATYEPRLLARYPASLYEVDFDRASLEAQSLLSRKLKQQYSETDSGTIEVSVFPSIRQMDFQLILAPVWVGTILEADGDTRLALVNGQTGAVGLGKSTRQ